MASTEDARAAIERHLYECEPAAGMKYQSSLIAILGDARGAANRDGEGRVKPNKRSQSWLGATAYLIMLDQVGKVFKVNGAPDTFDHPIGLAISHFTPIQDEAIIEALYALRCALAHDYSLFNRDKHGTRPMRDHAFNFTADTVSPLVEFPSSKWNRIYKDPPLEQTTVVNLRRVGDLGETVVRSLRRHHREETLGLRLSLDEFEWRYGMLFRLGDAEDSERTDGVQ
jgi:hypothetical protein